jgi:hypothetical protein
MKLKKVKLSDLTPDPRNTRRHDERNIKTIMDSLEKFGQYRAFVVQKQGMVIRVGNGMYEAMRRLGWTEGQAEIIDLTDEEATALSIVDNRSAELATWDEGLLAETLDGLPDDLIELTGFDDDELSALIGQVEGGTSTERNGQGVGSTWGQVGESDNVHVIFGSLEFNVSKETAETCMDILQREFESSDVPYSATFEAILKGGTDEFSDN